MQAAISFKKVAGAFAENYWNINSASQAFQKAEMTVDELTKKKRRYYHESGFFLGTAN